MARRGKYFANDVSKVVDNLLPIVSPVIRSEIILCVRRLMERANSTPNPIDNMMIEFIVDVLDIDPKEPVPQDQGD